MPKLEAEKERVGVLKFWLAIAVGAFIALTAWMAQNYKSADDFLIFSSSLIITAFIILIVIFSQKIDKKITQIGEM